MMTISFMFQRPKKMLYLIRPVGADYYPVEEFSAESPEEAAEKYTEKHGKVVTGHGKVVTEFYWWFYASYMQEEPPNIVSLSYPPEIPNAPPAPSAPAAGS